jgi:hypothetical protein
MKNLYMYCVGVVVLGLMLCVSSTSFAQQRYWELKGKIDTNIGGNLVFADSLTGYVFSGKAFDLDGYPPWVDSSAFYIYRTTDGGNHWGKAPLPESFNRKRFQTYYQAVPSSKLVTISTHDEEKNEWNVYISYDKCETWVKRFLPASPNYLRMFDENKGVILDMHPGYVKGGRLWKTSDGWQSYTQSKADSLFENYLANVKHSINGEVFLHSSLLYSNYSKIFYYPVSEQGGLSFLFSPNGGDSWLLRKIPISLYDTTFFVGNAYLSKSVKSIWMLRPEFWNNRVNLTYQPNTVNFLYSNDFGIRWNVCSDYSAVRRAFAPVSDNSLWMSVVRKNQVAAYDDTDNPASIMVYTSDNGKSWYEDKQSANILDIGEFDIRSIHFPDSTHGYALGMKEGDMYLFKYIGYPPKLSSVSDALPAKERKLETYFNREGTKINLILEGGGSFHSITCYLLTGAEILTIEGSRTNLQEISLPNYKGFVMIVVDDGSGILTTKVLLP